MKFNILSVGLGVVLVAVALYVYKEWTTPTVKLIVKKEGFEDTKATIGAVMGGIVLTLFVGFMLYAMFSSRR